MDILEINNCTFSYEKGHYAVKNLSLKIKKGEFISILGHNGSGKSTLAKLIVGLLSPKEGSIYIDGKLLNEESLEGLRHKIGIIFQNPDNQFVGVTVKDDIAFGLENRRVPYEEMIEKINYFSSIVGMNDFLERNPETLSGGEKQRVAIAGALAYDPDIIIFDEATSMLDPKGVKEVNNVINKLKGQKTILAITHNLHEALNADRVIVMNEGEIVLEGTSKEVFKNKDVLMNSGLDILDTMKIINLLEKDDSLSNTKEIEEILWELTYQK